MDARQRLREERVQKPQKGTKNLYQVGDQVTLQNPHTQIWDIPAQITGIRTAPDNKVLSYDLRQENGNQTTRHRVFIRGALPNNVVVNDEAGGADTGIAEPDDPAETIHEPVSSRLRPRARAVKVLDELVENIEEPSNQEDLALSLTSKLAAGSHLVTGELSKPEDLSEPITMSSCNCTCALIIYSCFSTVLWVGLAAILGHTSHTAVTCDTIQDTQGSVEIINEETVNVDFFNSHTAKKSEIK